MAKARKKRAAQVARKVASRKPRRTTTTITTTRVVKTNPRKHPRRRRNPASVAALKRRRDRLQVAAARRIDVAWKRGQTPAEIRRTADRIRALDRADQLLQRRTRKRRNPVKKKRSAAQRRAFRKMLAGLHRHQARKNPGRKKRRGRARRRKTTAVVVSTNPRRKRRKNSRGGSIMAKRRRRRTRTNPGRRHHRRRNPHRRHRRRNPGGLSILSIVKSTISAAIPSLAGGAVMALVDVKVLGDKAMPIQVLAKLGLAGAAGYVLRGRPRTAALAMGAMMGSLGYQLASQAAGGVVAPSASAGAKQVAALIRQDPTAMQALVARNGTLMTTPQLSGMGQSMGDGGTALPVMPVFDPITLG